jgi:hypothetical protein
MFLNSSIPQRTNRAIRTAGCKLANILIGFPRPEQNGFLKFTEDVKQILVNSKSISE